MGRSGEILRATHEESYPLRRARGPNFRAEFIANVVFPGDTDEHQIVQIGPPPASRFDDICRAINLNAELSHYIGAQIAFRLRGVQQ
jgi:hypothetical protein